ncbi:MAG: hypothetical protein LBE33_01710 [Zoogloeaceae bacterium]|jgi:hypothetical protein|nr:hypothetical protein [Zoogloeaceae bacterium]
MKELKIMVSSVGWDYLHSPQPIWIEHGFEPLTLTPLIKKEHLIIIDIRDGTTPKEIFRQICNVGELQEWLSCALLHIFDPPPVFLDPTINLLKSIHQFYENASDTPDDEFDVRVDELFEFRRIHDIVFGFRGCSVPSILFGSKNSLPCIWYVDSDEYIEENVTMSFAHEKSQHHMSSLSSK